MHEKITVVGAAGKMGKPAVESWRQHGDVLAVDLSPSVAHLGVPFVVLNGTLEPTLAHLAKTATILHIATPLDRHIEHLDTGLAQGVQRIMVEKPVAPHPLQAAHILDAYPNALIQADYLERANPAVLAIRDAMKSSGFTPKHFFHWRARDARIEMQELGKHTMPPEYVRFAAKDLGHDLSVLDLLLTATRGISIAQAKVVHAHMEGWKDIYGERYPWDGDTQTEFSLAFPQDVVAHVKGRGDNEYKRYFLIVNEGLNIAFFGQTLSRPSLNIEPFTAVMYGKETIAKIHKRLDTINRWRETERLLMLNGYEGVEPLDLSSYNPNPLDVMTENLLLATSNDELICPLSKAIAIEKTIIAAYAAAGRSDFLNY